MEKIFTLIATLALLGWIICAIFFEDDGIHVLGILSIIFFLLRYFYEPKHSEEETSPLPFQEENKI